MICQKCKKDFEESQIQVSHDVPIYLFEGNERKKKKKEADQYGRHNLCIKCHDIYERILFSVLVKSLSKQTRIFLRKEASNFASKYFGDKND